MVAWVLPGVLHGVTIPGVLPGLDSWSVTWCYLGVTWVVILVRFYFVVTFEISAFLKLKLLKK